MSSKKQLNAILEKYKNHPEFLGLDLNDPNQRGAVDDTVLHLASRTGAVDEMVVLIDAGADVNVVGDLGNTPLHQAVIMGQIESVKFLLRCGAKRQIKNEFDQTPLDVAKIGGNLEIINLLYKAR